VITFIPRKDILETEKQGPDTEKNDESSTVAMDDRSRSNPRRAGRSEGLYEACGISKTDLKVERLRGARIVIHPEERSARRSKRFVTIG
jgi:hypothetical protein